MLDLRSALGELSTRWNNKLDEIAQDVFRFDIGLKLADGTIRYQYVYIWVFKAKEGGRDRIYMNSRAGTCTPALNFYELLKDNGGNRYCTITITDDKLKDGTPCETIITQASPYVDATDIDLLGTIIFEVANTADWLEERYFGGDNN